MIIDGRVAGISLRPFLLMFCLLLMGNIVALSNKAWLWRLLPKFR